MQNKYFSGKLKRIKFFYCTGCGTQNENDGHTRLMGRSFEVTKML